MASPSGQNTFLRISETFGVSSSLSATASMQVDESEMLRAQAFARAASVVTPPPANQWPVVSTLETPPARQKRPRAYSETGEIAAATAMLLQAAGGRREPSQSPNSDRPQSPKSARIGVEERGIDSHHGSGGSGGSPATGDGRSPAHSPYKNSTDRGLVVSCFVFVLFRFLRGNHVYTQ